jgi:hypothetical protein
VVDVVLPPEGAVLADTVRARLRVEGCRPARVRWEESGRLIAEQRNPPWAVAWLPGGEESIPLHVRVTALDADSSILGRGERLCSWFPDGPPRLEMTGIPAAAERAPGESLRVAAWDPEDGALSGPSITWRSNLQGKLGNGAAIPAASLIPGRHAISVRAEDRWRRAATVTFEIRAFSFTDGSTPGGALEDLRWSLLVDRPDRYHARLDPEFRFVFCPADRFVEPDLPAWWGREEEAEFAARAEGRIEGATWTIAALRDTDARGSPAVLAEIREIEVTATAIGDSPESPSVHGGSARVLLLRSGDPERWRILLWNDLGAEGAWSYGRMRRVLRGK